MLSAKDSPPLIALKGSWNASQMAQMNRLKEQMVRLKATYGYFWILEDIKLKCPSLFIMYQHFTEFSLLVLLPRLMKV
jgi:hypothetical protein